MNDIEVVRGNDLYFPNGNENGDHYEPLFIARKNGQDAHGRTPIEAVANWKMSYKSSESYDI